ncbi:MAG: tetratricopeptide repeat protein [Anaerolineaceae bacterium]
MTIERVIGIDFGTTATFVKVKRYQDGKPVNGERLDNQVVAFDKIGSAFVPSMIQKTGDNTWFGYEAESPKPGGVVYRNFKLDLECQEIEKRISAQKLTREYFRFVYKKYQEQRNSLGEESDAERTIVSFPSKWKAETRNFITSAAKDAGFPNVSAADEACSAIDSLMVAQGSALEKKGLIKPASPVIIMVIDLGAEVTDITLCRSTPGNPLKNEILTTWPPAEEGIHFGGHEVDEILCKYLSDLLLQNKVADYVVKNFQRLMIGEIKTWKEMAVSSILNDRRSITTCSLMENVYAMVGMKSPTFPVIDRRAFQKMMQEYLMKFSTLVNGCIEYAQKTVPEFKDGDKVDFVLLTGGHSQWYFIKDILTGYLPEFGLVNLHAFRGHYDRVLQLEKPRETVSLGLVYQALLYGSANNSKPMDEMLSRALNQDSTPSPLQGKPSNIQNSVSDETSYRLAVQNDPNNAVQLNNLGVFLYNLKRYKEAEDAYRQAIEKDPKNGMGYFNLAKLLDDLGRKEEAEAAYRQALKVQPDNGMFYFGLGRLLDTLGRSEEAEENYQNAVKNGFEETDLYSSLASLLFKLGKKKESVANFKLAIQKAPGNAHLYCLLAEVYLAMGKKNEAEIAVQQAIQKDPDSVEAYESLGLINTSQGKLKEAEAAYRKIIQRDPENVSVYENLGLVLSQQGQMEEAESAFRKSIKLNPKQVSAYFHLALTLDNLGRIDEAEEAYHTALKKDPGNLEIERKLASLLEKAGRAEDAAVIFRKMIEADAEDIEAYCHLGKLLEELGHNDEAESVYHQVVQKQPKNKLVYTRLGFLLENSERKEEAEAAYRTAIENDPDDIEAYNSLGNLLDDLGRAEEAETVYRQAIEKNPKNAVIYKNLGFLLENLGRKEEAEAAYWLAIQNDPDDLATYHYLGRLLEELGRLDEAEAAYDVARRKSQFKSNLGEE